MKTTIKNMLGVLLLLLVSLGASSQPPMGSVTGKVVDSKSNAPLPYTNVLLLKAKDSTLVSGIACGDDGSFRIENVMPGAYVLKIKFIGYRDSRSDKFVVNPANPNKNFGVIKLNSSSNEINEVTVRAQKDEFINTIDKKVYNVANSITATGGSASDVLKNIPSVTVDIDGKVSLRGSSNVTIMIDGKPAGMLSGDPATALQLVPSSMLESVEVVTNPSAKYDAEGMAGIINLKTKKGKSQGMNGVASVGASTLGGCNANINLNNKVGKWNFYGNYGLRGDKRSTTGVTDQYNSESATREYNSLTNSSGKFQNTSNMLKLGTEWAMDSVNTLGLSIGGNLRDFSRPEDINYQFFNGSYDPRPDSTYYKNNQSSELGKGIEGNLDYKRLFPGLKSELNFLSNYSVNTRSGDHTYTKSGAAFQKGESDNKSTNAVVQADYSQPTSNGKFETGLKYTLRDNDNDQRDSVVTNTGSYVTDRSSTNHYRYKEQIYAAYLSYTAKMGNIGLAAGLRAEGTHNVGESLSANAGFTKDTISFFPNLSLKYIIGSSDIQASYSRRVNRPDMRMLNPFVDNSDNTNIRKGNPNLNPEYTNSFDVSWHLTTTNASILASVFYRKTVDKMSPIHVGNLFTFENFNSAENIGLDLTYTYRFGMLGNIMVSGSAFQNKTNAENVESLQESKSFNWNARMNAMLMLSRTTSLQVMGMFMGPMTMPNGTMRGMSGLDLGIKQDLWKGKASLLLNVSDVFNTRKMHIETNGTTYRSVMDRQFKSQAATLTFTYRFGKTSENKGKKRDMQQNMQQDNQMLMDSF